MAPFLPAANSQLYFLTIINTTNTLETNKQK